MTIGELLAAIGVIIATGGAVLAGISWGKGSTMKATNDMLEKALRQEREQREQIERRCDEKIAELSATVAALTARLPPGF